MSQKERSEHFHQNMYDTATDGADCAMRHMSFIFGVVYMWVLNPDSVPIKKTFKTYLDKAVTEISTAPN